MLPIYTSAEIKEIDRYAAEQLDVPTSLLMENAGRAVADVVLQEWRKHPRRAVLVVCGKGNNGGDGYVAARHLKTAGLPVALVSQASADELKGDAQSNARAATLCGVPLENAIPEGDASGLLIVDAVLGTGVSRPAEGAALELIKAIRSARSRGAYVVAVDVPSGLNADTPYSPGTAVEADQTVALHGLKPAQVQFPARGFCGRISVATIGIPWECSAPKHAPSRRWLEAADVRLEKRHADAHKGTAGHVLVVAGSPGKSGAAYMACAAALRSGAGLVTLGSALSVIDRVLPQLPEAMGHELPAITGDGLLGALQKMKALVIGPGIPKTEFTGRVLVELLQHVEIPSIIDADGLNALAADQEALANLSRAKVRPVLTPHPAEMARLLQSSTDEVQRDRLQAATEAATRFKAHVILKGACSVIAHPDGSLEVNSTGNPAMGTAGMGDVLSGVCGALLGQGLPPAHAATVAAFVHGRAGDMATVGDRGLVSTDLIAKLPAAFAELTQ